MMLSTPLTSPAAVFFTVFVVILVAPLLAERVRLPGIVGLVVAGLAVGPSGLGLLERAGLIEQMGGAGILYLMFLAGLELDVASLGRQRRAVAVLSAATFALPLTLGIAAGVVAGYNTAAAVLLGSLWASHTLIVYPLVRKHGLQRAPAVVTTVAATVVTDTLALLVLAVVVKLHPVGRWEPRVIAELSLNIAVLGLATLVVMPRAIRWLLRGIGQDRPVRVLLVLIGAFGGALVAESVGIEGIIGSFLMGLSLNRLVPRNGVVLERLELLGTGLLIPVFLLSVGMLIDIRVMLGSRALLLGVLFTGVALLGKGGAAVLAGRIAGYGRDDIGVIFSLSAAQAAATLAATVVGFEVGLFDDDTVHAVLIVILMTVIVASWVAGRFLPRISADASKPDVGERVIVPVANPAHAEAHVEFASRIALADRGLVMPLHVVVDEAGPGPSLASARSWLQDLEQVGYRCGVEAHSQLRLDTSVARGVARAVGEHDASLVVVGWSSERSLPLLGRATLVEEVVARSDAPVLVLLARGDALRRVVLALCGADLQARHGQVTNAAVTLAAKLSRGLKPGVVVAPDDVGDLDAIARSLGKAELVFDPAARAEAVVSVATPGDLVILPGGGASVRSVAAEAADISAAIPGVTVAVVFGPHAASGRVGADLGVVRLDPTVRQGRAAGD